MPEVPLTQGRVALVDDDDYKRISRFKWCARKTDGIWYALRSEWHNGKPKTICMHRFILNAPAGKQVDHVNGDGLDNRKKNLRLATNAQNSRNSGLRKDNTSGYKGVCRSGRKWTAEIRPDGETRYIGTFNTDEEAARAYDAAARFYYGEFARLNFPDDDSTKNPNYGNEHRQRVSAASGFRGVRSRHRKWEASISINGRMTYLGMFYTKEEAARSYDTAAVLLHGEFARINFPEKLELIRRMLEGIQYVAA